METTEKIVEAYVRYVCGWATIPNIKCGQYEIDLLYASARGMGSESRPRGCRTHTSVTAISVE
jgi:hypothetical protein